jgi:hypothetical protein
MVSSNPRLEVVQGEIKLSSDRVSQVRKVGLPPARWLTFKPEVLKNKTNCGSSIGARVAPIGLC